MLGRDVMSIDRGWQVASAAADAQPSPTGLDSLDWLPANVPGTAAGARVAAGLEPGDLDAVDWWFRTTFEAAPAGPGEEVVLGFDGLATIADVFLNGEPVLHSESMFERHRVGVGGLLRGRNEGV